MSDPGPDPMSHLLDTLADPNALAERIVQLQKATGDSVKALEAAKAAQAKLDQANKDHEPRMRALEDRTRTVVDKEDKIAKREQELSDREAALKAETAASLEMQAKAKAKLDEIEHHLIIRDKTIRDREMQLEPREQAITDAKAKLVQFEKQLYERQADIDARMARLRELVEG